MTVRVPIVFLSEAETLRRHARAERGLTATQRLQAVSDLLATVEALSRPEALRAAEFQHQQRLEAEWRRRMKEFIQQHGAP